MEQLNSPTQLHHFHQHFSTPLKKPTHFSFNPFHPQAKSDTFLFLMTAYIARKVMCRIASRRRQPVYAAKVYQTWSTFCCPLTASKQELLTSVRLTAKQHTISNSWFLVDSLYWLPTSPWRIPVKREIVSSNLIDQGKARVDGLRRGKNPAGLQESNLPTSSTSCKLKHFNERHMWLR